MEAEFNDATGRWRFDSSEISLSRLLAGLCRSAIFNWSGFSSFTHYLLPMTVALLSLAVVAIAFRAKQRNGYRPFLLGLVAAIAVLLGKFVRESKPIMYTAFGLLVIASLWNAWPHHAPSSEVSTCPDCERKEVQ